jgi:transcriptional regulator with XRE-family HTH domain
VANVHNNVRKIRLAKGITQKRVYDELGITNQSYSNFELHGMGSTTEKLDAIAKILGEQPGIFFDDRLTDSVIKKLHKGVGEYARRRRRKEA